MHHVVPKLPGFRIDRPSCFERKTAATMVATRRSRMRNVLAMWSPLEDTKTSENLGTDARTVEIYPLHWLSDKYSVRFHYLRHI